MVNIFVGLLEQHHRLDLKVKKNEKKTQFTLTYS